MKFSIVVPIYNVEKYVEKCINSILKQNYKLFELILVDDGSSDTSGLICDKYKDCKNIKIIHQKNAGLSMARNAGISLASGDYLMFVDGDDFLYHSNVLNDLNNYIKKYKSDILQYKMIHYYENNLKYKNINSLPIINCDTLYDTLELLNINNCISISACDKIIKTSIIKDNNLFFKKGLLSEDIDWSLNLYLYAKTITVINENYYVYRQQRKGSITNKTSSKNMNDLLYIIFKWYNYPYNDSKIKNIYYNYIAYQFLILLTKSNSSMFNKNDNNKIRRLKKELLKYDGTKKVKMFNKYKKIMGLNNTVYLMRVYLFLKNKGIIKI